MAVLINGDELRTLNLGRAASKASGTLSATTIPVFTITGGEVLITSLYLKVTTSITGIGTLAAQINPTTGDTMTIVTATDLGTTDTVAGSVVGLDRAAAAAPSFLRGGHAVLNAVATTGQIELLGASAINGAVTVYVTWIPLSDGASLVAA